MLVFPVSFLVFGCCRCSSPPLFGVCRLKVQREDRMNSRQPHENLLVSCRLKSANLVWWWVTSLSGGTADKLTRASLWQTERFPWWAALWTETQLYCHHYGSTWLPFSWSSSSALLPSHLSHCVLLLSSFALTRSLRLFQLPPHPHHLLPLLPALNYVLLRKCASAGGEATASELGGLQSWGRRGWCVLCMASYTAAENHGTHTDT